MALHVESWVGGPLSNNIYLLWDEASGQAVLIDPSIESEPARERLRALEQNGVRLQAIWNTHGHFDHIYDNARWKQEYSVPLLMHSADEFLLEYLREQSLWFGLEAPATVRPDADLNGVDELHVGEYSARVLHTPGHSPGSVAFWFPEEKLCISGDVLFQGSVGRTDLPGASTAELAESLRRLSALPPDTRILPGHGAATTIAAELASNPHCRKLIQESATP
jgi:glyoxylase-like metal-dependent hydrolase (beta-lactamase superfamily II)